MNPGGMNTSNDSRERIYKNREQRLILVIFGGVDRFFTRRVCLFTLKITTVWLHYAKITFF